MKIKTSEATPPQINWLVCLAEGNKPVLNPHRFGSVSYGAFDSELGYAIKRYSTDWSQGGPIIERERLILRPSFDGGWECTASPSVWRAGQTPLIAAMRCFVTSKLGDEVDVPEELV